MHPSDLDRYLNEVADKLGEIGGSFVEAPEIRVDPARLIAVIVARLTFHDATLLDVRLTVSGTAGYPEWVGYSFQYMKSDGPRIFRYDNSPYHRIGPNHPHHKHVGPDETPTDQPRPSLSHIIDEITAHLYQEKTEA